VQFSNFAEKTFLFANKTHNQTWLLGTLCVATLCANGAQIGFLMFLEEWLSHLLEEIS
jgi:hypothetical protein